MSRARLWGSALHQTVHGKEAKMNRDIWDTATLWYDKFSQFAEDLYPGRYTRAKCVELAEQADEVRRLATEKRSMILVHNYQYPELQEIGHFVGDSLGLAFKARDAGATRIDFSSVHFMGATAKIIVGDATRVFVQGDPDVHSCSLVRGTDHRTLARWKKVNPTGVLVTYVNSDAYTKAFSDYICTSGNTAQVILQAMLDNPSAKVLVLPDKYLGLVMKQKAVELAAERKITIDKKLIEVYSHPFAGYNACCYVHEKIGPDAPELALEEHPNAELLLHPECGCASSCLAKLAEGKLPANRVYYRSTEGMLTRARESKADKFIVGTEIGMVYRLRKLLPEKTFAPIAQEAVCDFMKQNTLEKLVASLRDDKYEIVFNDDADPKLEVIEGKVIKMNRDVATKAKVAIDRMLAII